jgi:hypothetical protein
MEAPMTDQQVSVPTLLEAIQHIDVLALQAADDGRGDAAGAFAAASYIIRESVRGISQPCETCGGRGEVFWNYDYPEVEATVKAHAPCPACNGQGYRYTGGLVERLHAVMLSGDGCTAFAALSAEIGPNPEGGTSETVR